MKSILMALLALGVMASGVYGQTAERRKVFGEVRKIVEREYYDARLGGLAWETLAGETEKAVAAAKTEQDAYEAMNRMLAQLQDRHTAVSSPTTVKARRAPSQLGLGLDARVLDGKLAVTGVRAEGPLRAFGVERGWLVKAVAGTPVPDAPEAILPWLVGLGVGQMCEAGAIRIEFETGGGERREYAGGCSPIGKAPIRKAERRGDVLVVRFDRFDAESAEWFDRVMEEHQGVGGLVLDLRENLGGLQSALCRVASRLLPVEQSIGGAISRRGKKEDWMAGGVRPFAGKMVVLVDRPTMSAAEILSAALQESGRARVIGRPTSGSVLAMESKRLSDGGELRISVKDFVTAKGRRLEKNGVEPDVPTAFGLAELRSGEDRDMARALGELAK